MLEHLDSYWNIVPEEVVKDFGKINVGLDQGTNDGKVAKIIRRRMNISRVSDYTKLEKNLKDW